MVTRQPGRETFTFRFPTEVKEALRAIGQRERRSLAFMVEEACREYVERDRVTHGEMPKAKPAARRKSAPQASA